MTYFLMVSEVSPTGKYYRKPENVGVGKTIKSEYDAIGILAPFLKNEKQEHFVVLSLNGMGVIQACRIITVGLLNRSLVHPREVFRDLILDNAASCILAHNHPSGSLEPSTEDIAITNQLRDAGKLIGIAVLDHIIVAGSNGLSMRGRGFF